MSGVNAFTRASWDADDKATEKARQGLKWRGPNREPRETLLKDRKTNTCKVVVKDATPANVKLARAMGLVPPPTLERALGPVVSKLVYRPEPLQTTPKPIERNELTPRFVRWWPGAKPEECPPVY